jgi:Helix-turn-helix domain
MSWPIEYRVLRTKGVRPNRIDAQGRPYEAWRGESIYREFLVARDQLGQWDPFSAEEANLKLSELMTADESLFRSWWPDGVVDLMGELVCTEGYEVEGRYEPEGEWQRLEPGFKDLHRVRETTDYTSLTREEKKDLAKHWYWNEEPQPSYSTMARRLGVSEKTIYRWVNNIGS